MRQRTEIDPAFFTLTGTTEFSTLAEYRPYGLMLSTRFINEPTYRGFVMSLYASSMLLLRILENFVVGNQ